MKSASSVSCVKNQDWGNSSDIETEASGAKLPPEDPDVVVGIKGPFDLCYNDVIGHQRKAEIALKMEKKPTFHPSLDQEKAHS